LLTSAASGRHDTDNLLLLVDRYLFERNAVLWVGRASRLVRWGICGSAFYDIVLVIMVGVYKVNIYRFIVSDIWELCVYE
jgi:hypothetical protein